MSAQNLLLVMLLQLMLFPLIARANLEYKRHQVLEGDTVSEILEANKLFPIYGKRGSLQKLLEINPNKQASNGDLIYQGEELILPIAVKNEEQIEISESIDEEESLEQPETPMPNNLDLALFPLFWFQLGFGISFMDYYQTIVSTNPLVTSGDLAYNSLVPPSIKLSLGGYFGRNGFSFSYLNSKGEVDNTDNGQAIETYTWSILEADYLRTWVEKQEWGIYSRLGLVSHNMPLLSIDNSLVSITNNDVLMAALGFGGHYLLSTKMRFEIFMRYQHPISASGGENFDIDAGLSFDGSVGVLYQIYQSHVLGLYWYGQSHDLAYTFEDFSGDQNLFFSNLDIRYVYEF